MRILAGGHAGTDLIRCSSPRKNPGIDAIGQWRHRDRMRRPAWRRSLALGIDGRPPGVETDPPGELPAP
jgi:hypothetical protein